jgi:uncharacterized protein involved in outer membrane biogenesis
MGAAAVMGLVIVAVVLLVSNLGPVIKTAVNTYGPGITKTALEVDGVGISIFTGRASLNGFLLGNPAGFKAPHAVRVGSIAVDVDRSTLTKETVVINKVEVVGLDAIYERARGTDNFHAIIQNVQPGIGTDRKPGQKGESKPAKKLIIRDLTIKGSKVTLMQALLGDKGMSVPVPDIHLKNVGGEKGGASPAVVADEVLRALYGKITSSAVMDQLNEQAKSLTGEAAKQVESLGGAVKGLLGK